MGKGFFALLLWLIPIGLSAFILQYSKTFLYGIFEDDTKNNKIVKVLKDIKSYSEKEYNQTISEKPSDDKEKATVYFCQVLSDQVRLVPLKVKVGYGTNKIEKLINTLLKPPHNLSQSYTNLIPEGTSLLDYKLKDGLLTLNFNANFLRLSSGEIGNKFKVAQVVSTMTSVKGIDKVTFIVNGKVVKYLDYDGIILNRSFGKEDIQYHSYL
jgi:spore germination protein GerM